MEAFQEQSLIIGVLYLIVFIAGICSVCKVIDGSDYLAKSALHSSQIYRAAAFQFLMALLYIEIIILFYPILKGLNIDLAFGFLGFRLLAIVFVLIGTIILFSILKLSKGYNRTGNPDTAHYVARGDKLKYYRDVINHAGMIIALCLSNVALFLVFFQSESIPAWISIWGIIAALIAIFASLLALTKRIDVLSKGYIILNVPIILQELVFAVWLIFIGLK